MSTIRVNIAANFIGKAWTAVMSIAFVPLYIKFMGVEAYGLVGIYLSLLAMFSILDLGLSTTLTRELARLSMQVGKAQEMRNLVRSLEVVYWGIAVLIGVVIVLLAPIIAQVWVKADRLAPETIAQAVVMMGISIAMQWPFSLYSGGLMGLQRQVLLNVVAGGMATLRGVGSVLILYFISPTIQAFFLWQAGIGLLQTIITAIILWINIEKSQSPATFKKDLLKQVSRFAVGVSGASVLAVVLTQSDKIILSKLLPLEMFGYYSLAALVASGLYYIVGPISSGMFPRFAQLVSVKDDEGLKSLYHQSCQLLSVLVLPVSAVVGFFSEEILTVWTMDPKIAGQTHLILSLLLIGNALNCLMTLPYSLQLAHGLVKIGFYANLISVVLLLPLIFYMATAFGAIGGAMVWVILNCGYFLLSIQVMHRFIMRGAQWNWYFVDVGIPLVVSLTIVGLGRWALPEYLSGPSLVLYLAALLAVTIVCASLVTPATKRLLIETLSFRKIVFG